MILILWLVCSLVFNSVVFFFFLLPHPATCRILVPLSGIESGSLAVKAQNPNYWTARDFPMFTYF